MISSVVPSYMSTLDRFTFVDVEVRVTSYEIIRKFSNELSFCDNTLIFFVPSKLHNGPLIFAIAWFFFLGFHTTIYSRRSWDISAGQFFCHHLLQLYQVPRLKGPIIWWYSSSRWNQFHQALYQFHFFLFSPCVFGCSWKICHSNVYTYTI